MQLVVDPLNPDNVVLNAAISIYDPLDTAGTTLLPLKDLYGFDLPNPLNSNHLGFIQAFTAELPQIMWKSGDFSGYFNSYKGLRDEAVAARAGAETAQLAAADAAASADEAAATAAAAAVAPTDEQVDAGIQRAGVLTEDDAAVQAVDRTAPLGAALAATFVQPRKNKAVLLGNSIEYYNFGDAAWQPLRPWPASRGYVAQGNSMLGHRLEWSNRGVGGEDTGAYLARVQADLVDMDAGYAVIGGPTNDVTGIDAGWRTIQQTKDAYNSIWDLATASGKYIIQVTAPPRDAATSNQKALRAEINQWLRAQAILRRNYVVVDIELATMDPVTGGFVAGYSWDGVHLATPGAVAAGAELARKLDAIIPQVPVLLPAGDARNILKNNGGSFSGTATAVPTGWSVVGATGTDPTYSRVAFTDRPGQKLRIVMPNGSIRFYRSTTLQQSLAEFAPGQKFRFAVGYSATGLDSAPAANTQAIYAVLEVNGVGVAMDLEWNATANPNGVAGTQNENMGSQTRSGVLLTPTYTIPAGSNQTLAATFQVRGGGTYEFWNPSLERVA
jgi:hypothetical protein